MSVNILVEKHIAALELKNENLIKQGNETSIFASSNIKQ